MTLRNVSLLFFAIHAVIAAGVIRARSKSAEVVVRSHRERPTSISSSSTSHTVLSASGLISNADKAEVNEMPLPYREQSLAGVWLAYPAVAVLVAGIVIFLYWPRGLRVVCSVLAYLIFLSTMKLTVKYIFVEYSFNYPKFVCSTHFLMGYFAAVAILMHRSQDEPGFLSAMSIPKVKEFFYEILPISLGFATSIAANNMALVFSSAAFTEIVGCTTPIFSVLAMMAKGMPVDKWSLVPVALVIVGCSASITGEVHFSAVGMALCLIANAGRAIKGVLQQVIMSGKGSAAMDPVNLLAWMCLPSFVLMGCWSLQSEGLAPFRQLSTSFNRGQVAKWILISAVNATALNLSQIYVTKEIGVVGSQLTAQSKAVLTMLGAVMLFNEIVTPIEWAGFVVVLMGVYLHTRWEAGNREDKASKDQLAKARAS